MLSRRPCRLQTTTISTTLTTVRATGTATASSRAVLAQLYDEASINAVLQEWFRTVADLPLILRQAVSMGLFSSAQLVRFLSMDVRPSVTRAVTRRMPPQVRLREATATLQPRQRAWILMRPHTSAAWWRGQHQSCGRKLPARTCWSSGRAGLRFSASLALRHPAQAQPTSPGAVLSRTRARLGVTRHAPTRRWCAAWWAA